MNRHDATAILGSRRLSAKPASRDATVRERTAWNTEEPSAAPDHSLTVAARVKRSWGFAVSSFAIAALMAAASPRASAQSMRGPPGGHDATSAQRPAILNDVGIDQKLGEQVPLDLVFRDESGREVKLGDYFGKKPVILSLVYFECPGLCTVVLNEQVRTLRAVTPSVGDSFEVITVSFDPRETPSLAASKKAGYVKEYGRPGAAAGWHFLTGDAEPIRRLTESVGFRYAWDAPNNQFVHSSGFIVLTPQGKTSRYFFGVDYNPTDVRKAVEAAGGNAIGTPTERVVLYCFQFNPQTGKYGLIIGRVLKLGGAADSRVAGRRPDPDLPPRRGKAAGSGAGVAVPGEGDPAGSGEADEASEVKEESVPKP